MGQNEMNGDYKGAASGSNGPQPRHYPRNIGIAIPTPSDGIYECLIAGKDRVGALVEISSVIAKHGINMIGSGEYHVYSSEEFVFTMFADFSKTRCTPEQLKSELERVPIVTQVDVARPLELLFDRYLFPLTIMDKYRVVVMRAEPLLKIEDDLTKMMGSGASAMMFEVGKEYGVEVVKQYKESMSGLNSDSLMRRLKAGGQATGWGHFDFVFNGETVFASLTDPPESPNQGTKESRFLVGVLAGLVEGIYGFKWTVATSRYDKESDVLMVKLAKRL